MVEGYAILTWGVAHSSVSPHLTLCLSGQVRCVHGLSSMTTLLSPCSAAFAALLVCTRTAISHTLSIWRIGSNHIPSAFLHWDDCANKELPTPGTGCSAASPAQPRHKHPRNPNQFDCLRRYSRGIAQPDTGSRLFRVKSAPGCYSNWWQKIDLFP